MPRSSTFLAIVAILVLTSRAGLGFPSSRLTYVRGAGTESCPDEAAVRRAVAARLGYDPFFPSADKTIVARVTRAREKLHASVELVDDKGMVRGIREFDAAADQCEELMAAAALAISIAIDPSNPSILGGAPAAKAPGPDKEAPPGPPTQRSPEPPREGERRADVGNSGQDAKTSRALVAAQREGPTERSSPEASLAVRPGIAVIGALRTAPAAAIGFGAFLELRQGDLSIALEGRFDLPASTPISEDGRLRTSLRVGSVLPCFHLRRFFVCATGSLGSLRAEGVGLPTSRTKNIFYGGLGGRVGVEIPLTERFFLRPQLDVVAALFPAELQVDHVARWTAPRLAALAGIGVGARFP